MSELFLRRIRHLLNFFFPNYIQSTTRSQINSYSALIGIENGIWHIIFRAFQGSSYKIICFLFDVNSFNRVVSSDELQDFPRYNWILLFEAVHPFFWCIEVWYNGCIFGCFRACPSTQVTVMYNFLFRFEGLKTFQYKITNIAKNIELGSSTLNMFFPWS